MIFSRSSEVKTENQQSDLFSQTPTHIGEEYRWSLVLGLSCIAQEKTISVWNTPIKSDSMPDGCFRKLHLKRRPSSRSSYVTNKLAARHSGIF